MMHLPGPAAMRLSALRHRAAPFMRDEERCIVREAEARGRIDELNDVILDFTDMKTLDLQVVSLLFTAREKANDEDRQVWVAGLPDTFWVFLRSMGLEEFFQAFPDEPEVEA